MILWGKSKSYEEQYDLSQLWHKCFAWLPVIVDDNRMVWLEYVMRTKVDGVTVYQTRKYPNDFQEVK